MQILDILNKKRLYFDGAMGTMLQKSGKNECGEILNIIEPELVTSIHRSYVEAGCDILKTNTFGANPLKLNGGYSVREVVSKAVENAKNAADENTFIAIDLGPTGKLLEPLGTLAFEEAVDSFSTVALLGEEFGADLVLIETMSDTYELKAAVLGAKKTSLPIFAMVTMDKDGHLLTGADILSVVSLLEGLGVSALGINCGLSCEQAGQLLPEFLKYSSIPIILNPNAGLPIVTDGVVSYDMTPEKFSDAMKNYIDAGILGGCCGTTPEHINLLIDKTKSAPFTPVEKSEICVVSSYRKSVILGEKPVCLIEAITEDINNEIKNCNYDNLVENAIDAFSDGADIVSITSCGNIKMDEVIREVQSSVTAPLLIKTENITLLSNAMRVYNGKPLIALFDYSETFVDKALDLIKIYGGVLLLEEPLSYIDDLSRKKGILEKNIILKSSLN